MQRRTAQLIADTADIRSIFKSGAFLYRTGSFRLAEYNNATSSCTYGIDGDNDDGDYQSTTQRGQSISFSCIARILKKAVNMLLKFFSIFSIG